MFSLIDRSGDGREVTLKYRGHTFIAVSKYCETFVEETSRAASVVELSLVRLIYIVTGSLGD